MSINPLHEIAAAAGDMFGIALDRKCLEILTQKENAMIYHVVVTKNATLELGKPCPVCGRLVRDIEHYVTLEDGKPKCDVVMPADPCVTAHPCGCKMVYQEPPMTLEQFAEKHRLYLRVFFNGDDRGRAAWTALFDNTTIVINSVLHLFPGFGSTEKFAIEDYARGISGRTIIVNGNEIKVPELRIEE